MPFEALSAKARLIVPVGAIESRWLLRRPCSRISARMSSGRRFAMPEARSFSASKSGNAPFSRAMPVEAW